jgi:hypothetical protein
MTSTFSGFFGGGGGTERVGSVRGGFYGSAGPDYERLDGRTILRATYPDLEVLFPIGKMTGTARTLAANPTSVQLIATANHFVAAGANTANAVQFSSDGASWATSPTAGTVTVSALIATPSRFVALSSTANAAIVSSNLTPAATWSTTTTSPQSVTAGSSMCRMTYHAAGTRVIAVHPTIGVYTLDDGSTTWTTRTSTARQGVASTGSRVIGITASTATASVSLDNGLTWADFTLPEALSASQGNIASNGAGTVVISGCPSGLQVSLDHGVTWKIVRIPGVAPSDAWRVQFSDSRFFVPTTSGLAMSSNGEDWFIEPNSNQSQTFTTGVGIAKKGMTVVEIPSTLASLAYSLAESSTEFPLPVLLDSIPVASGTPLASVPLYIRAQ